MTRLTALTTAAEWTLLACSVLLVLAVHLGGHLAPGWVHSYVPLAEETWQLLPMAQIVLLAAWLVCGIGPLWLRVGLGPVLVAWWAVTWGDSLPSHTTPQWLLLSGLAAALLCIAARCAGFRLAAERSLATEAKHPQFSIRGLLLLTTLIAALLGILELLRPSLGQNASVSTLYEQVVAARLKENTAAEFLAGVSLRSVVLAAALAVAPLVSLACVLRPGRMWLRLLVAAALVPLLGIYLANLTGDDLGTGISLAVSLTVLAAIAGISAWPLRLLGVRFHCNSGFGVRGFVTAFGSLGSWRWGLSENPTAATSRRNPNLKEAFP